MDAPDTLSSIDLPCNEALAAIRQALSRANLRSLETFDLQAARLRAMDCQCPHHGSAQCDCQMVVLLVYGGSLMPATLILHGNNGRTWLSMPDDAARPIDPLTAAAIEQCVRAVQAASGL